MVVERCQVTGETAATPYTTGIGDRGPDSSITWPPLGVIPTLSWASMVRISVPGLPQALLSATNSGPRISVAAAAERIAEFLGLGNTTLITGAGVSVDSGTVAWS
jgi:hypothetical protein